jgi:hypothetical protein
MNSISIVAVSLAKSLNIKEALLTNDPSKVNFNAVADEIDTKKEFLNLHMEIIDKDGKSFVRNWTDLRGDDLLEDNENLKALYRNPKVETTIEASKFGATISTKVPIYQNGSLLGFFALNVQLDNIAQSFKQEGFKIVMLLNHFESTKIVQNISHTRRFIEDIYVVNNNAKRYLIKVIKEHGIHKTYCKIWKKDYFIEQLSGHFVAKYIIKNQNGSYKICVFMFKDLKEIEFPNIHSITVAHITTSLLIAVFIALVLNFIYANIKVRDLAKENQALIVINEELTIKTNEMDYNDKKLENLFNMQPNLMMMHNGKEIIRVNQRFLGFFNRFGGFDGFRREHKCVSELFEPYDAPNYISTAYIDGLFWIDYILKNPKRMYKIVMSYKDKRIQAPHHFIIKLNEMEYARKVNDRLVIIALVDMTQDLPNYKTKDERELLTKCKEVAPFLGQLIYHRYIDKPTKQEQDNKEKDNQGKKQEQDDKELDSKQQKDQSQENQKNEELKKQNNKELENQKKESISKTNQEVSSIKQEEIKPVNKVQETQEQNQKTQTKIMMQPKDIK